MDGSAIVGFVAIGALVIGNVMVAVYSMGRLRQKVEDLCGRVTKLENTINGKK